MLEHYYKMISIIDLDDLLNKFIALYVADKKKLKMQLLENNDYYKMWDANEKTGFLQKYNENIMKIISEFNDVTYYNINVQILHMFIKI